MQKMFLHGENAKDVAEIRSVLEANLPYSIHSSVETKTSLELLSSHLFHLLVFEAYDFSPSCEEYIREIRSKGFSYPVLVVSQKMTVSDFYLKKDQLRAHHLPKPLNEKALLGIARKLMTAKTIPQQVHRRFRTNELTRVEPLSGAQATLSNMFNLSKGGVYVEDTNVGGLSVGEMVRLRFRLDDVKTDYTLNAKVVWSTKKGRFTGQTGLGMKFVSSRDVHRYMIERM